MYLTINVQFSVFFRIYFNLIDYFFFLDVDIKR